MPTDANAPKGGDLAECPSSRSGSGSSEGAAPAALAPGPRERGHIEHLANQSVDPHGEPEPEPGPETEREREPLGWDPESGKPGNPNPTRSPKRPNPNPNTQIGNF